MKKNGIIIFLIFYFACSPNIDIKPDSNYIPLAETNYRKYFKRNYNNLDPLEGIWTEYVVGTLYDDGKVIERKEIAKRARWIVIKKGSSYKILNEYGEQNTYEASFKHNKKKNSYTFDCLIIKTKDHIKVEAKLIDGKTIEMSYNAPKGIFEDSYKEFMLTDLPESEQKNLELFWQFNWLKTFPLDLDQN